MTFLPPSIFFRNTALSPRSGLNSATNALQRKRDKMSMKLYVGNLPDSMTEETLSTMFSEAGPVASAKIIMDRYTGQPRGFGFVEMETKMDGQRAISMLNGRDVEGRTLKVNEARPQRKRGGGGSFGGGRHQRRY